VAIFTSFTVDNYQPTCMQFNLEEVQL